jgi:hypothetical protein
MRATVIRELHLIIHRPPVLDTQIVSAPTDAMQDSVQVMHMYVALTELSPADHALLTHAQMGYLLHILPLCVLEQQMKSASTHVQMASATLAGITFANRMDGLQVERA